MAGRSARIWSPTGTTRDRSTRRSPGPQENARGLRDRISTELWEAINRFYLELGRPDLEARVVHRPYEVFRDSEEPMPVDQRSRRADHAPGRGLSVHRARLDAGAGRDDLPAAGRSGTPASAGASTQMGFHAWVSVLKSVSAYEAYLKAHDASLQPDAGARVSAPRPGLPPQRPLLPAHRRRPTDDPDRPHPAVRSGTGNRAGARPCRVLRHREDDLTRASTSSWRASRSRSIEVAEAVDDPLLPQRAPTFNSTPTGRPDASRDSLRQRVRLRRGGDRVPQPAAGLPRQRPRPRRLFWLPGGSRARHSGSHSYTDYWGTRVDEFGILCPAHDAAGHR